MANKTIDLDKHIWEGWRVRDFIAELQPQLDEMFNQWRYYSYLDKPFMTKEEMREWCRNHQPYYKKRIPEVSNYFIQRYNIKK